MRQANRYAMFTEFTAVANGACARIANGLLLQPQAHMIGVCAAHDGCDVSVLFGECSDISAFEIFLAAFVGAVAGEFAEEVGGESDV